MQILDQKLKNQAINLMQLLHTAQVDPDEQSFDNFRNRKSFVWFGLIWFLLKHFREFQNKKHQNEGLSIFGTI